MTPSEILLRYRQTDSADFLSELEGEDLWKFLEEQNFPEIPAIEIYFMGDLIYRLHPLVVAELKAERNADWDTWNNLLALDLGIKQGWIDDLQMYLNDHLRYNDGKYANSLRAILEYLKERKWK